MHLNSTEATGKNKLFVDFCVSLHRTLSPDEENTVLLMSGRSIKHWFFFFFLALFLSHLFELHIAAQ